MRIIALVPQSVVASTVVSHASTKFPEIHLPYYWQLGRTE